LGFLFVDVTAMEKFYPTVEVFTEHALRNGEERMAFGSTKGGGIREIVI
jgi:hypothetical protein